MWFRNPECAIWCDLPNDFLERLFNKVTWIFRSLERKEEEKEQEEVRKKEQEEQRARREREAGEKVNAGRQREVVCSLESSQRILKSVNNKFQNTWLLIEKLPLICFWFPFQGTLHGQTRKTPGLVGRLVFYFFM